MPTCVRGVSVFISAKAKRVWDKLNNTIDDLPDNVACRDSDPDAWFADEEKPKAAHYNNVKKLCAACPVQAMCLEYAMTNRELHGIWGGLAPKERWNLNRKIRRAQGFNA